MLQTPVVLIIFNRPKNTQKVWEIIRQVKPAKLLVIADGSRADRADDIEKCAATRAVIDLVDWDCEVLKNYSDVNLGCGLRISSGLDWVFEQVESAIILEDDCLPHPDFFSFCQELLTKYRDDLRIMHISGNYLLHKYNKSPPKYSYYFSRYPLIWGWATWRRAWQHYDFSMSCLPEILDDGWFDSFLNRREKYVWTRNFVGCYQQAYTWDYQWFFSCWIQSGLAIMPNVNLVSNIGFAADATHTQDLKSPWANLPSEAMSFPLEHPPFTIRDAEADRYLQNNLFDFSKLEILKTKLQKILNSKNI